MAITRQLNILGQMRVDGADLRSIESAIANDFDLMAGLVLGGSKALVVRGFTIDVTNSLNNPAANLVLRTADGILMHFAATEAGTLLRVPAAQANEPLNSSLNPKVSGGFSASAINYIGIDYRRTADATTSDVTKFVSSTTNAESARTVPKARTLSYNIVISTSPFSLTTNICPIARVQTDASNRVLAITDARQMLFRLGRGGDVPNDKASYQWIDATRRENAITYTAGSSADPFSGGDKSIASLKDWMDAVQHVLWEAKSGEYWYSQTSRDSMKILFSVPIITSSGSNFLWVAGTSTITWRSAFVAFENSTNYYNPIADGSAVILDGQCIYVDINRGVANVVRNSNSAALVRTGGNLVTATTTANHGYVSGQNVHLETLIDANFERGTKSITVTGVTTFTYAETGSNVSSSGAATWVTPVLVPLVGTLTSLPAPTIPGSRIIFVWRISNRVFARDYPFDVDRNITPVATTAANGIVRLHATPNSAANPAVVAITGANNDVAITASGGDATAITAIGNGTGTGLFGQGGGTAGGVGVRGIAGGTGTIGITTTVSTNVGVIGTGRGDGSGVEGRAGGDSGVGVRGIAGGTGNIGITTTVWANTGVLGTGRGPGAGVEGRGGGDDGVGVRGVAGGTGTIGDTTLFSTTVGVAGTGRGPSAGVEGRGGGTDGGIGIHGIAGGTGALGILTSSTTNVGVLGTGRNAGAGVEGRGGSDGVGVRGEGTWGMIASGTSSNGIGILAQCDTGSAAIGVSGSSTVGTGVSGYCSNTTVTNAGVIATNTVGGYALIADNGSGAGTRAPFRIVPSLAPGGPNAIGDIYMTTAGVLRVCTTAGTPGVFAP